MRPNIVFLDQYSIGNRDVSSIEALGNYTSYDTTRREEIVQRCKDANVVITNKVVINRAVIESLPKLRLICIAATGMNNVDLAAADQAGIEVKNAVGYSTNSVAETTIGAAIALMRNIVYYDKLVKSGAYSASPLQFNYDRSIGQLHGKNWGIIGLGNIGRRVAEITEVMGCKVAYTSTSGVNRKEKYQQMTLSEILAWADVLSIHCPLSDKTTNLLSTCEFAAMKPTAIVINVARGKIVDEQALAKALDLGQIAGAALDVFSKEPIEAENPLLGIKDKYKLILSPHNAWASAKALDTLVECICENIKSFLAK